MLQGPTPPVGIARLGYAERPCGGEQSPCLIRIDGRIIFLHSYHSAVLGRSSFYPSECPKCLVTARPAQGVNAQVDSVAGGTSETGPQSLSLSGLTRLWSKITGAFAALTVR